MLEWAEAKYPDSALFLYFKSRILRLQVFTTIHQSLVATTAGVDAGVSFCLTD